MANVILTSHMAAEGPPDPEPTEEPVMAEEVIFPRLVLLAAGPWRAASLTTRRPWTPPVPRGRGL